MKKLKRPSVGNVERENERNQTYDAKNPKIDLSRTHDNYHIIAAPQSYMDFINERIASLNLKRKVRSDAIYMNTFVLSSGHEFFENMPTVTYFYGQFFYIAIMQKYLAFRIEAESCFFPPFYLNKR